MNDMDGFQMFMLAFCLMCLNIMLVLKIQDKIIPVLFMVFSVLVYMNLFSYTDSDLGLWAISILFVGLSIYINVKGVELL